MLIKVAAYQIYPLCPPLNLFHSLSLSLECTTDRQRPCGSLSCCRRRKARVLPRTHVPPVRPNVLSSRFPVQAVLLLTPRTGPFSKPKMVSPEDCGQAGCGGARSKTATIMCKSVPHSLRLSVRALRVSCPTRILPNRLHTGVVVRVRTHRALPQPSGHHSDSCVGDVLGSWLVLPRRQRTAMMVMTVIPTRHQYRCP